MSNEWATQQIIRLTRIWTSTPVDRMHETINWIMAQVNTQPQQTNA